MPQEQVQIQIKKLVHIFIRTASLLASCDKIIALALFIMASKCSTEINSNNASMGILVKCRVCKMTITNMLPARKKERGYKKGLAYDIGPQL